MRPNQQISWPIFCKLKNYIVYRQTKKKWYFTVLCAGSCWLAISALLVPLCRVSLGFDFLLWKKSKMGEEGDYSVSCSSLYGLGVEWPFEGANPYIILRVFTLMEFLTSQMRLNWLLVLVIFQIRLGFCDSEYSLDLSGLQKLFHFLVVVWC